MNLFTLRRAVSALSLFGMALVSHCAHAATYTVVNLNSSGAGSLSQAMSDAKATTDNDTINFSVSGTITVPSLFVPSRSTAGEITVSNTQSAAVVLSGGYGSRLFEVGYNGSLSLKGLTLSNGFSGGPGGAIYNNTDSSLSLSGCTLSNNSSSNAGGAIYNNGSLFVLNSTLSNNSASTSGGAIVNYPNGSAYVSGSTFSGNSTTTTTGGSRGGAIDSGGTLSVSNSTFANNSSPAGQGGAIFNGTAGKVLTISSSTLTSNSAGDGGGVANVGTLNLKNSIVANNSGGNSANVFNIPGGQAVYNDQGNNITSADPMLAPLADNGGPTFTMRPRSGSPAIDTGLTTDATDQRGVARPQGIAADIGAFEVTGPLVVTSLADNTIADNVITLREAITAFNASTTTTAKLITFAVSGTITLGSALPPINTTQTSGALSISNTQSGGVTLSGGNLVQILSVPLGANLTLDRLTLSNGRNNTGGAIGNVGTLTASACTFSGNTATTSPGGGAIYNNGNLSVSNSTFSGNTATAGYGGGIANNDGRVTLQSCTLSNNTAGINYGGGGFSNQGAAQFTVGNSIVAGNNPAGSNYPNIYGGFSNTGPNITAGSPGLGALGDNGGPTFTMLPQSGSPAIDAGSTALSTDQRGYARPFGVASDIGAVEVGAGPPSSFVVTSLLDTINPSDGVTTLREAIMSSNSSAGTGRTAKTITFAVTGTITLGSTLPTIYSADGSGTLSIGNTQSGGVTISGANSYRIFTLGTNANLSLSRLTLSDGKTTQQAAYSGGGAIFNGGGIVSISGCTLSNNVSTGDAGGAIFNNGGTLSILNSTLSGNSATSGPGGAIMNIGTTVVSISSSTLSNNSSSGGGAIINFGNAISLNNSIVAGNTGGNGSPDIDGGGGASGNNNISSNTITGSGNIVSNSPLLGALSDNGGPTFTLLPLSGSPAINTGAASQTTDQRGIARPQGSAKDIGAVEVVLPVPVLSIQNVSQAEGDSGVTNMVFTVSLSVPTSATVSVKYSVLSGSAKAGTDFGTPFDSDGGSPGVLSIPGGATTGTITVPIVGDQGLEIDETFQVALGTPTDATVGTPSVGVGTIQNDDSGLVVTTLSGVTDAGDNDNTLREAITTANTLSSNDTITFGVTGTIRLTGALPSLATATTAGNLTISNTQTGVVTISGDANNSGTNDTGDVRLFAVDAGAVVTLNNLTLSGGHAEGSAPANSGGALYNLGTLNVSNCTLSGNAAQLGGGVWSGGTLLLASTTSLSGNTSINGGSGSGLYVAAGTATVNGNISGGDTVVVMSGGALAGTGTISSTVSIASGGAHAPGNSGPGTQNTGDYLNNGLLSVDIADVAPGSGFDQVNVTGAVALGGTLKVTLSANYLPTVGDKFTLISNDGTDTITPSSSPGLTEASLINSTDGRATFQISYIGGDGNDLVLTTSSVRAGSASPLIISQFRLSGPGGPSDEFIELANTTNAPLDVSGWSVVASGGVTVPLSGSIPAKGRLLLTNIGGYSLGAYASGDITYTGDIAPEATLSLQNATPVEVDGVGNLSLIASPTSATSNYAYLRRLDGGAPRDNDSDATDFTLVDINSTGGGTAQGLSNLNTGIRLGAPGPHNLSSPIQRNAGISNTALNPGAGFNAVARYGSRGNTNVDTQGRLSLRRNIKNNTGATVTRMRFRLVALTSGTSTASGVSDLRAISSAGVMFNGSQVAQGATLEAPSTPTASPLPTSGTGNGGGLNSSWTVALPSGTLAPGASIGVEFLFGIQTEGSYRIVIDTELLP